jgi:RND family efflux transporter MFP subunit
VRSAESQLAVAQREEERTKQLVAAGAVAQRDADVARGNVAAAEAALADARSRLASAETSLADAVIRSPLNGIVASRVVNAGDVVTAGAELFTIIDPSSMRLEAAVPARDLRALRPGASVRFSVRGYDESFDGRIERIGPRADAATGQVPIFVTIMNANGRLIAGLFAEGRVATESADGLVVPMNAVNTAGDTPWVVRVTNGVAEKIPVTIGLRDPHTETLQIVSGVNQGDILLRGAAQGITPGTPVQVGAED